MRAIGVAAGLATALLWGSWAVVSRLGVLGALDPWDISVLRYLVSTAVLAPVLLRRGAISRRGVLGVPWRAVAALSLTGGPPYMLVVLTGLGMAPASRHAVFGSGMMPLLTLAFSALLLSERPSAVRIAGTALATAGVVLTVLHGLTASEARLGFGEALFFLSAVLWAGYTVASRIWQVPALPAVAILSLVGAVLLIPVYLSLVGPRFLAAPAVEILGQAVFQGLVTGLLATFLYMRAIEILGPARASLFVALVPPIATVSAWPILGERPGLVTLAGVALVSLGMVVAVGRR
ncbi:MAG: DMT family transporter [Alphaproteobacteria bacterium]|nr:DMT family transporter [Alphaproteobacteria bacterium]